MTDPPSGAATFLFTDIEGRMSPWERGRAAMQEAVERHLAILWDVVAVYGGVLFNVVGHSAHAAGTSARKAGAAFSLDDAVALGDLGLEESRTMTWHESVPRAVLALLTMVLTWSGVAAESATPVAAGDVAGLVDIGGRSLYLECRGAGSPTVILEAGFRTRADVWSVDLVQPDAPRTMVLPGVAAFTRVCAYDRPGTSLFADGAFLPSRSDPVPMPRTAQDAVADLHALLEAAAVPGPYVLVGHSFGGLFVRLFAATYPDEVAGLVLVDAFPEVLKDEMTPEQWRAYDEIFQPVPPELAGYPDLEFTELDVSVEQVREAAAASPLPPELPLVVLSRGMAMAMPSDLPGGLTGEMLEDAWRAGQDSLATLVPGARHVIATESEHYIQLQQPELVIEAVRAVVDAVREPAS